jgi:predicted PurR-regulated permease PerM
VLSPTGDGPAASIQEAAAVLSGSTGADSTADAGGKPGDTPQSSGGEVSDGAAGLVQRGASYAFALAGHVTVITFLVFFLLLSGHHVRNRAIEVAGQDAERRRTIITIIDEINGQIERFLLVRLVTAVIVGALTWMVLAWLAVQNAAVWGILAGVFNSIPYFGPIIVSGGLLMVGLVQGGGTSQALQMAGAALAITSLEGWLLTPPLMGKAERMSALAVFLGLLLWTWIWGAWGTILAVPMLVVVKAVADHVPRLKPVGRLLAP